MRTLTPAERRALRAKAHHLAPGRERSATKGLTRAVLHEIDVALNAHELIKVRVFDRRPRARASALARRRSAPQLDAQPVQHLGKILTLWRPSPEPEPDRSRGSAAEARAAQRAPGRAQAARRDPQRATRPGKNVPSRRRVTA